MGEEWDSYFSTTTESGKGEDVMASRRGYAIACKTDAGIWITKQDHDSYDGCGVCRTCHYSQAGMGQPVYPSTSLLKSRHGICTSYLSQPGDVFTYTLGLSRRD